jgi:ribonucleotide reductase alpha subunit
MTLIGEWAYSDNALAIYKRLYFDKLKGETKPSETHVRISKFLGDNAAEKNQFYNILDKKIFRPNSPCMINAGSESKNPHDRALSACYVLGLEDSMDSIIEMWGVCAKIYASGA